MRERKERGRGRCGIGEGVGRKELSETGRGVH